MTKLLLLLFVISTASVYSVEPEDTTKSELREPFPEPKGFGSKLWAVPQFLISIPINVLEGFGKVVIDDLYLGKALAGIGAMSGDIMNLHGFYPIIGRGSRSGIQYGLAFKTKGVYTKEDRFKIKAATSANDYDRLKIRYITPNLFEDKLKFTFLGEYRQSPRESFYGIGNSTFSSNEVNYNPEHSHVSGTGLWTINRQWDIEFALGYDAYNIFDGEDPDLIGDIDTIATYYDPLLFEYDQTRLLSFGGTLHHDWRNDRGQPTSGGEEIISATYNKSTESGDSLKYWRTSIDLRQYLELFKKRTLAIRVMAQSTDVIGNSQEVPFYLKNRLGGSEVLRGYRGGRFIDNDLALISIEYRYPLLEFIDAFIFLDEGRVFNNFSDNFKWRDWRYATGVGLRIWEEDNLIIKTSIAFSKEDTRFYFEFSDAF